MNNNLKSIQQLKQFQVHAVEKTFGHQFICWPIQLCQQLKSSEQTASCCSELVLSNVIELYCAGRWLSSNYMDFRLSTFDYQLSTIDFRSLLCPIWLSSIVQVVVQTGTFGDLEERTNALQVILDCFSIKSWFFGEKKSLFPNTPFCRRL